MTLIIPSVRDTLSSSALRNLGRASGSSIVSSIVSSLVYLFSSIRGMKKARASLMWIFRRHVSMIRRHLLSSAFRSSRVYHAFEIPSPVSFSSDVSKTFGRMILFPRISITRPLRSCQVQDSSLQKYLHLLSRILSNFNINESILGEIFFRAIFFSLSHNYFGKKNKILTFIPFLAFFCRPLHLNPTMFGQNQVNGQPLERGHGA